MAKGNSNTDTPQFDSQKTASPATELPTLQFSLKGILSGVACLCLLLTILSALNGAAQFVLLVTLLIIAAHILATFLGGKLCSAANSRRCWMSKNGIDEMEEIASRRPKRKQLANSKSSERSLASSSLQLPWMRYAVVIGAALGGILGAIFLAKAELHHLSFWGWLLGSVSASVLGAWATFLTCGFWGIGHHAWREAEKECSDDS